MAVKIGELKVLYVGGRALFGRYDRAGFVGFSGYSGGFRLLDNDPLAFDEPGGGLRPVGAVGFSTTTFRCARTLTLTCSRVRR